MARRKSKADVLRNEKYMDDAVFSAFKNLHKAAKRKSEYVWATEKFSSLDSIWGDPIEPENSNILDVSSNVSKNPEQEPKPLKRQYGSICTKLNTSQLSRSNQADLKLGPNDSRKTGLFHEQSQRSFTTRKLSLLENFENDYEKRNSCSRNESEYSNQASKDEAPNMETLKLKYTNESVNSYKHYEDRVKREVHKINSDINANYERSSEDIQKKQNFHGISPVKIEDHSRHSVGEVEVSRLPILENDVINATPKVEENDSMKSHKSENEFQSPRSKISSCKLPQKEKTEKPKRKRLYLSSSVNSLPDPKHSPVENQNRDTVYGTDKRSDMLRTMLALKIYKGDKFFDFVLELSDFKRMKKRFPKLQEVFPEIDGEEKELCYSADAVKVVFGFLLNIRYDAPDERTAVEVLAATKSWEMYRLHAESQQKFLKTLNRNKINLVHGAAVHYGLQEIYDVYKGAFGDDLSYDVRPYRQRKCNVSLSTYIEPREFCIPSKTAISILRDNFDRDITNEITFKAITGSYVITGLRILLNLDNERDNELTNLEFNYVVRNPQNHYEEEVKVRKRLRSNITINFHKNLEVNQNQTAEIVIETSIKPYLCLAIEEKIITGWCDERLFSMNMKSTYKVANSKEKRFFIEKLLYYPKT